MFVAFSLPEKICGCAQRHITKNVSEYKHTANAELQKCRKFVNILSTIYIKVSGNKRKTNAKLHYTLKMLQYPKCQICK